MTSRSRLEKDAEALVEVIAERVACNMAPTHRGFDGVAGKYDFHPEGRQKFRQAYDQYSAAASNKLSTLTAEEQKQLCENLKIQDVSISK